MLKRTKTGCISCRIRRVKCDETKPHCLRCRSAHRRCDGYLPEDQHMTRRQLLDALQAIGSLKPASEALGRVSSPSTLVPEPSRAISLPANKMLTQKDFIFFDYFRRTTAPSTENLIPSTFWCQDLLQLAHSEPAIWHATLALGALHRRWELESPGGEVDGLVRNATAHYAQALALAKDVKSPAKILALSLPLIASANMLGFWSESHIHLLSSFKILAQGSGRIQDAQRLASTLTRMDIQSITFNDRRSPYPFAEASTLRYTDQGMVAASASIESYSQGSAMAFALIREVMINGEAYMEGYLDTESYASIMVDLYKRTEQFERQMAEFEAKNAGKIHECAAMTIRMYHCWLRLVFKASHAGQESRFDAYLGYLQRTISLAYAVMKRQDASSKIQLSLEPAMVAPLFEAGRKCRHPALRRHCLKLLKEANRHEGMWRSDGAAAALEKIIEIEEGDDQARSQRVDDDGKPANENYCAMRYVQDEAFAVPWEAWSSPGYEPPTNYSWLGIEPVPEERRVTTVMVLSRFDSHELDLEFLMSSTIPGQIYGSSTKVTIGF